MGLRLADGNFGIALFRMQVVQGHTPFRTLLRRYMPVSLGSFSLHKSLSLVDMLILGVKTCLIVETGCPYLLSLS